MGSNGPGRQTGQRRVVCEFYGAWRSLRGRARLSQQLGGQITKRPWQSWCEKNPRHKFPLWYKSVVMNAAFKDRAPKMHRHRRKLTFVKTIETIFFNVTIWVRVVILYFLSLNIQIKSECLSCRHGVAVFDMSYFGKFYLTGPDAKKAADWLFTADVNKKPGQSGCYRYTHGAHTPRAQAQTDGGGDWLTEPRGPIDG